MGYSTCAMHGMRSGPKCCDGCDRCPKCSGIRLTLRHCPANYCADVRLCAQCWVKYGNKGFTHESCIAAAAAMAAREETKTALIAHGQIVRCAAVQRPTATEPDRIHVLFDAGNGHTYGRYMSAATYHAIDLETPATPSDYAAFGPVTLAPPVFQWETAAVIA